MHSRCTHQKVISGLSSMATICEAQTLRWKDCLFSHREPIIEIRSEKLETRLCKD